MGLRRDLYIVARADSLQNEAKLLRAGASKVVSPHILGGRWMAITAINPAVTDFITAMTDADHSEFLLSEFAVTNKSACAGMTFANAQFKAKTGALIVALRSNGPSRSFIPNPPDDRRLAIGDTLIAIGSPGQLTQLARLLNPSHPQALMRRAMLAVD